MSFAESQKMPVYVYFDRIKRRFITFQLPPSNMILVLYVLIGSYNRNNKVPVSL